ncbi:SLIT and NTRK-like protein isoform 2 [Schistosoma japonicum]|uniref:SLIT and NTRK-like protein isoform 2 n=1 Tax=Schistosoma japonicum TaxID=6182 RepID=A0A4Z2DRN1_SCHJA|nr:SLIT and NTRK-like protein isoform 2 [Schistosoma japonicum]
MSFSSVLFIETSSSITCLLLLFLTLHSIPIQFVHGSCETAQSVIICTNEFPSSSFLNNLTGKYELIIRSVQAKLDIKSFEKYQGAQIRRLQIERSTIYSIEPKFFNIFSRNSLERLSLSNVDGSYRLDAQSLAGLSEKLNTLRINDHTLENIDDFVILNKLTRLYLVRTHLTQLPENFKQLLTHLEDINLSENFLTSMPWKALADRVQNDQFLKIQLGKNLWNCDCSLKPLIELKPEAKAKVYEFHCHSPENLKLREITELTTDDVCKEELSRASIPSKDLSLNNNNTGLSGEYPSGQEYNNYNNQNPDLNGMFNRNDLQPVNADQQELATAGSGGLSTEMIIVIAVVIACIVILIISLIIYSSRKRAQRRKQQERNLGVSHKTNSYW